ncbi:hypothetical protein Q3C01_08600 [Bradyrhizobium sp. UFLA05-109]
MARAVLVSVVDMPALDYAFRWIADHKGAVMVKRTKGKQSNGPDVAAVLQQVAELISSTNDELQQFMRANAASSVIPAAGAASQQVNSWDDPFSEAVASVDPAIAAPAAVRLETLDYPTLGIRIAGSTPASGLYNPGTTAFRYWVAAEALSRGINFWGSLLPSATTWSTANPMQVSLVEAGEQLNANYTRTFGLRFYRQTVRSFDIYSCESPDVVCHELGHAVLDALRPQLFNAANTETSAFHESFGDMSAILCALQIPEMRKRVVDETGGRLNINSRLSRLAEQLGWGIRQISPRKVDRDCLRNAANSFFYKSADLLPPVADANLLSSEEHSFSRIFTGAFLDALARMYSTRSPRDDAALLAVSRDMAQLLIDAIHGAPIVETYFSQVAASIVQADQARFGGRYKAELTGAFLEHGILSVASALQLGTAPVPTAIVPAQRAASAAGGGGPILYSYEDRLADDAHLRGLGDTPELPIRPLTIAGGMVLNVHATEEPLRFSVASAAAGGALRVADDSYDKTTAAQSFVEGLIQRQQVDLSVETKSITSAGKKDASRMTHALVQEGGKMTLKRICFSCGSTGPARVSCTPD